MYLESFGLREKPFALSPDPRYLFLAESHREALAHLLYGVDQGEGFIAVVGEVGTGKTTLCRTLLQRLGAETEVAFLFNPDLSPVELLESVCTEFGVAVPGGASRRDLLERINEFLVHNKRQDRRVLLIIDEAQNLPDETLEQVRLLSNLETETSKLIQIILLGQPELEAKLAQENLRQLRQRISVWWTLGPLTRAETSEYVRHRLRVAGGANRSCFTESALREVHRQSAGVPRVVNILCDRALLAAYADEARDVTARHVKGAVSELAAGRRGAKRSPRRRAPHAGWWAAAGVAVLAFGAYQLFGVPGWLAGRSDRLPAVSAPPPAEEPSRGAPGAAATSRVVPQTSSPTALASFDGQPSVSAAPDFSEAAASALDVAAPAPPDLEALLAGSSGPGADAAAVTALLESWMLTPSPGLDTIDGLGRELPDFGLRLVRLEGVSLAAIGALNHPAAIEVLGADGRPRWIVLRHLEGEEAVVPGLEAPGPSRVPLAEIEARFTGRARVPWRDFVRTPPVLRDGHAGSSVLWLQRQLGLLGFYAEVPSGRYDPATRAAVEAFQRSRGLTPDGEVGPRTKMVLYDALGAYEFPRLREAG